MTADGERPFHSSAEEPSRPAAEQAERPPAADVVAAGQHAPLPAPAPPPAGRRLRRSRPRPAVPSTRSSATWTAVIAGIACLAVVLVFILENLQSVKVTFFGAHWRAPLGVDLLLAAGLGGLLVFTAGAVRLFQLRRVAQHHARLLEEHRRAHGELDGEPPPAGEPAGPPEDSPEP